NELGIFYFVTSAATVSSLVVGHGYQSLMPRFISRYTERGRLGHLSAFLRISQTETLKWSVIGAAAFALGSLFWPGVDHETRLALIFGALTIIPMGVHRVLGMLAISYRRPLVGYMPGFLIRPALFTFILGLLLFAGIDVTVWDLAAIQFATFIAVALAT